MESASGDVVISLFGQKPGIIVVSLRLNGGNFDRQTRELDDGATEPVVTFRNVASHSFDAVVVASSQGFCFVSQVM